MAHKFSPAELHWQCPSDLFDFETTAEITDEPGIIGQARAEAALDFALEMPLPGYNAFVLGHSGTGRWSTVKLALERRRHELPPPGDLAYVHNFDEPDQPALLQMPKGRARRLRVAMDELCETLGREIGAALTGESFGQQKKALVAQLSAHSDEQLDAASKLCEQAGFALQRDENRLVLMPIVDGEPLDGDQVAALDDETREQYEQAAAGLEEQVEAVVRKLHAREEEVHQAVGELAREVTTRAIAPHIDGLLEEFDDVIGLGDHTDRLMRWIPDHTSDFWQDEGDDEGPSELQALLGATSAQSGEDPRARYKVNVLVDNTGLSCAPVIRETNPTVSNLLGRLEHRLEMGAAITDFSMIKAGALHRANGGFLVLDVDELFRNEGAWRALTRALRAKVVRVEEAGEAERGLLQTLQPEPTPLDLKLVLLGPPVAYYLLRRMDEDFEKLFRVKVDFDVAMDLDDQAIMDYAGFIAARCRVDDLLPFDRSGVARVIEHSLRRAADQQKLSTEFQQIATVVREASFWAGRDQARVVGHTHVDRALRERRLRHGKVEDRIREAIDRGRLHIDVDGEQIGVVNGLVVLTMGDHSFGRPSRVTAQTYVGKKGVVNIERVAALGGKLHNKGVEILSHWLGRMLSRRQPLHLTASLAFEQSYGLIDGDSASVAELVAILSSLAEVPVRQHIAITGAVDQHGRVLPIGGVNEKVEGFFRTCQARGLTGEQGVVIPATNAVNLMLADDVVEAVEAGQFGLWSVARVEQAMELLTGLPAGEADQAGAYPADSLLGRAAAALKQMIAGWRDFQAPGAKDDKGKSAKKK